MNKLEEIEKKNQQLKEKIQKEKETVSRLKKENTLLKKELQDKNILLGNSPAGIVLLWHGRILEVNDTFLEFMGYKADEMINRNFLNFIHPDNLSEVRFMHNKWSAGRTGKGHYDTRLITEMDDAILCSVEARRIRYRGRASYLLNITRLEEREEDQKRKRFEVRKGTELKMAEGVKSLLGKRSEVILDILGFIQSSRELHGKNLDQVYKKLKSEHGNILKEIRMLEAITSGRVEYRDKKAIDINNVIDEAVNRITRTDEAGEIDIKKFLRASSSLNGCSTELVEALTQLLLNSVSNVSGAGEIYITTEENAGKIYIYIQDSGLSVRENKLEDIFELLSTERSSLVHELGMRYARAVIEKHNGEIEYLPGGGQGNIFQIVLPAFRKPPKRKKIDRNKLKKARILIIQPGDIAKELFAHLLAEKGCWVEKTGSTIDGLAAIKKRKINLLIADVEGMGMNNTAFWEKCRKINSKLITVGLKNGSNINDHGSSGETGPDHIISKPFDLKDAVNRISEIFMVEY
jgi:PAS domain S-box-containing protein